MVLDGGRVVNAEGLVMPAKLLRFPSGRKCSFRPRLEQVVAHKNADVGNLDASFIMWA